MRAGSSLIAVTMLAALGAGPGPDALAADRRAALHMPWKEAGLSERQAAAHLLNRFTFGPRPGEVDEVVHKGLAHWFELQLEGRIPDPNLNARLSEMPALAMSEAEIVQVYPPNNVVLAEARKAGAVSKEMIEGAKAEKAGNQGNPGNPGGGGSQGSQGSQGNQGSPAGANDPRGQLRDRLVEFERERGLRPERELMAQLYAQKVYRAAESQNQLGEVMTDFWFNHFNVSLTNGRTRPYLLAYERDAIRAHALGRVRDLLEATARHPAMLLYLDNAESTANPDAKTLIPENFGMAQQRPGFGGPFGQARRFPPPPRPQQQQQPAKKAGRGLNENYARELMELHTLGVDGGYSQQDVIEVARAFTGWTVLPAGPAREGIEKRLARARQFGGLGFHTEGDFLFRPDMHDAGPKLVLGNRLAGGRGMEDGEAVLDILARHAATARHLATQLAVRFVSDKPPQALVDRLSEVYLQSGGDNRELLRTIVESPEFWSKQAIGAKIKSPFELAVSAVRASGAHVEDPQALLNWIGRMGQPLYAYQAPTGYPDRAEAWVNTGSLLNRMNFGLQFAAERIRGVDLDLPSLHEGREPESVEDALRTYAALLMPGRNLEATLKLLTPMVSDPNLPRRVDAAAPALPAAPQPVAAEAGSQGMAATAGGLAEMSDAATAPSEARRDGGGGPRGPQGAPAMPGTPGKVQLAAAGKAGGIGSNGAAAGAVGGGGRRNALFAQAQNHEPTPLEQVVGVILGSPEFQRR
jgi:uncharacterized protein (DUF1800 family)